MDGKRFEETAKALVGSRRAALTRGAALALGSILSSLSPSTAGARTRLKKAYTCPPPPGNGSGLGGGGTTRLAQSFTATRSGTLNQIKVAINKPAGSAGDFVVQLVTMDGALPSSNPFDVIAAATVLNDQVKAGNTTLVAHFATTRLKNDTQYAVVVSRLLVGGVSGSFEVFGPIGSSGAACEGDAFSATGSNAFQKSPSADLAVTVLVG
jgi:hypothetical protein